MSQNHSLSDSILRQKLLDKGIRPTQHRLALASLLFKETHRHVTAESIHLESLEQGIQISLATVYNTLNCFLEAGLLKEVCVSKERCYFDTNLHPHAHLYDQDQGILYDAPLPNFGVKKIWDEVFEDALNKHGLSPLNQQIEVIVHVSQNKKGS